MRINKLLFFLLALVSLNSCVEYVHNGEVPNGPEKPEERVFQAAQSNPSEAKYVGDKFEFAAYLNAVDVTASTKFKVNGTNIPGSSYTPVKTGSHSVIATMDNLTATFKFTVEEKDEQEPPVPTGNRIEYNGETYPLTTTQWIVHTDAGKVVGFDRNGVTCTVWALVSYKNDANDNPINQFLTFAYVPIKANQSLAFPNNTPGAMEYINGGSVMGDGVELFKTTAASYTFAGTGNTAPADGASTPWSGTANYTGQANGGASGAATLFWNGAWTGGGAKLMGKAKMGNILNGFTLDQVKDFKNLDAGQIIIVK